MINVVYKAVERDDLYYNFSYSDDAAPISLRPIEDIQEELYKQLFGRLSGSKMPKAFMMVEGNPKH